MNWLLPAQTILDLLSSDPTPAHAWASQVDTNSLRVSVISIAQARAEIMGVADYALRLRLIADLASFLSQIEADSGVPPLPFTSANALVWEALMHDPSVAGVSQTDRQVYATAMNEGLTVVEERKTTTPALQAFGVDILPI